MRGREQLDLSWSPDGKTLTVGVPASVPKEALFLKADGERTLQAKNIYGQVRRLAH